MVHYVLPISRNARNAATKGCQTNTSSTILWYILSFILCHHNHRQQHPPFTEAVAFWHSAGGIILHHESTIADHRDHKMSIARTWSFQIADQADSTACCKGERRETFRCAGCLDVFMLIVLFSAVIWKRHWLLNIFALIYQAILSKESSDVFSSSDLSTSDDAATCRECRGQKTYSAGWPYNANVNIDCVLFSLNGIIMSVQIHFMQDLVCQSCSFADAM